MRLSIEWISEYIKVLKSPAELSKQIKLHTTNVESVQAVSRDLCNVIVGKVEQVQKHPDADKLIVCRVNMGNEYKQILTADLSVKEGDVIPVAVNGAKLASGMEIKDRKMRGIESQGMFCSLSELGLEEKSNGVYKLKEEVPLGTDFIEYFKLKDDIVEIEVFPNRPDLLSYIGAAKELQVIKAAEGFKLPEYDELSRTDTFDVSINYEGCKRYTALEMRNIKVGSSPLWLVRRLAACGIRSINNIVDITNYVMLESGHPVHAFDLDVIGRKIVVRKAQKGEKTVLLDEKEYELNGTETLITGEKGILALGGVMGCQNSCIT
ncbi:MAG TPA: phenylalanine--tRNA ligase subunit beta, partial [Petrotogaceae bacterium]|nr:phenylalanine--tRNA ligase subunit beta [Petrotogaceae bacterium]